MSTVTRVYATGPKLHNIAVWAYTKVGIRAGASKEFLAKLKEPYKIKGLNVRYNELDNLLAGIQNGTVSNEYVPIPQSTQQYNAVDTRDIQIQHYAELFSALQQCSNIRQVRKLLVDFQPTQQA